MFFFPISLITKYMELFNLGSFIGVFVVLYALVNQNDGHVVQNFNDQFHTINRHAAIQIVQVCVDQCEYRNALPILVLTHISIRECHICHTHIQIRI